MLWNSGGQACRLAALESVLGLGGFRGLGGGGWELGGLGFWVSGFGGLGFWVWVEGLGVRV